MLRRFFRAWETRGLKLLPERRWQADRLAEMVRDAGTIGPIPLAGHNPKAIDIARRCAGRDAGRASQRAQTIHRRPSQTGLFSGGCCVGLVGVVVRLHEAFTEKDSSCRRLTNGETGEWLQARPPQDPPTQIRIAAGKVAPALLVISGCRKPC
jgi:hypothetical protein